MSRAPIGFWHALPPGESWRLTTALALALPWCLQAVVLFLFITRCSSADSVANCIIISSFFTSYASSKITQLNYHARYAKGAAKSLREDWARVANS